VAAFADSVLAKIAGRSVARLPPDMIERSGPAASQE
jgi:hypothetical protein